MPGTAYVEEFFDNAEELQRRFAQTINAILAGRIRCTGTVTLDANSTTTTLQSNFIGYETVVLLSPESASASTVNWWISGIQPGQVTINHDSNAATDRQFGYVLLG